MHWRRGGREKQLKDDAHQRNSKVEMSLEWSQIAHKTQRSLSCPPVSQRQQWEHIQEIVALSQFSFVFCYVNMHKFHVFQWCLFMWLKKNKVNWKLDWRFELHLKKIHCILIFFSSVTQYCSAKFLSCKKTSLIINEVYFKQKIFFYS